MTCTFKVNVESDLSTEFSCVISPILFNTVIFLYNKIFRDVNTDISASLSVVCWV